MNDGLALTPERARALIDQLEVRLVAAGIRGSIRISEFARDVLSPRRRN